ncbi:MAG TPA: succinyl-diaminopimelate desuccinylase [Gaiellaceae bacterium]|nr:succinyl-diaminopimelate desuccinylase [Gaiellaceae bacterium]
MALAERTLELVNIPSESRNEQAIYEHLCTSVTLDKAYDDGESLIFSRREGKELVLLAGHTDTVPAQGNVAGRIEDGAVVGLGASDMKGGVAVMVELARWAETAELAYDVAFLFFPREEIGPEENPLPGVFERSGLIDDAHLVICLEPTDNTLQLGCVGNLNARVVYEGRSAHSARPWLGVNAIALALRGLEPVLTAEPLEVEVAGLVFREVMTVTELHAGIASNVVPGRAEATVNYRYAPSRTPGAAEERIHAVLGDAIEITSHAPPAHVPLEAPLVDRLQAAGGFEVQPKQAWTNVADFAARGLDAVNLGPGATRYAHAADERVEIAELERTYAALQRFLGSSV